MNPCLFCRIAGGEIPATVVHDDGDILAFRDIQPAAPVHVLVVPRRHIATLDDATPSDQNLLGRMMQVARKVAGAEGVSPEGYRLVMNVHAGAGQSVLHVHLHVLGGRPFSWPPG